MTPRKFQFSMLTLSLFVTCLGIVLGLNLHSKVEKTFSGNVGTFLNGYHEFPADQIRVRRGWPFWYLDHSEFVAYGEGDNLIEAGWPLGDSSVPRVSSMRKLAMNAFVGSFVALGVGFISRRFAAVRKSAVPV